MNLSDNFNVRTFSAVVLTENSEVAEQSITTGLSDIGVNDDEFAVVGSWTVGTERTTVAFAVSTMYLQDLPKLTEREFADMLQEVTVKLERV